VRSELLRAGDSDRAAVVHLLRAHHLDGRLTVEDVLAHGVGPLAVRRAFVRLRD
jgi:hypothetical protein